VAGKVAAGVASGEVADGINLKTAAETAAGRSLSRQELDQVAAGLGKSDWSTLLNQTSGKQFKDWQRDVARQAGGSQSAGIEPAPGKDTSPAAPITPAASDSTPGGEHSFKLGGRDVTARWNADGSTRIEQAGGQKVVTYTDDEGVRHGYAEDATGGNVRPFLVRKPAGGYDAAKPATAEEAPADPASADRAQTEADKRRSDRKAEFEKNIGHQVIEPQHVISALRGGGFESYKRPRPKAGDAGRGGVDVNAIPGKKTWLSVEYRTGADESADYANKASEMEKHLTGQGFHVERSKGDPNVLMVRKPLAAPAGSSEAPNAGPADAPAAKPKRATDILPSDGMDRGVDAENAAFHAKRQQQADRKKRSETKRLVDVALAGGAFTDFDLRDLVDAGVSQVKIRKYFRIKRPGP
jgi:hypothetical protein